MIDEKSIGLAAGTVWKYLAESDGDVTLASLKKLRGLRADDVVAAIGWLAREGKIEFRTEGRKVIVGLTTVSC